MREIKFRVWTGAKMEYDIMVGKFGAFWINPGKEGSGLHPLDSACLNPLNTKYDLEYTSVMQFTGLSDKYGVEIYEGDLLKMSKHSDGNPSVVEYNDSCFTAFPFGTLESAIPYCEVIGNIYESPNWKDKYLSIGLDRVAVSRDGGTYTYGKNLSNSSYLSLTDYSTNPMSPRDLMKLEHGTIVKKNGTYSIDKTVLYEGPVITIEEIKKLIENYDDI